MSLFESLSALNRSWDDRVLEHLSVRKVFLSVVVSLFMLGACISIVVYQAFRTHRFDLADLPILALLGIFCFRYARLVYRRLGA
jgi:H+/Cl- antiporter ClcA